MTQSNLVTDSYKNGFFACSSHLQDLSGAPRGLSQYACLQKPRPHLRLRPSFFIQLSPYKIEFGHVCEDPNSWEQRYEKKDFKNHRDMGKVRWGDKQGGYGEHYWDLNHAGHAGNHNNDEDDSYRSDETPYSSPYQPNDDSYGVHDTNDDGDTYDDSSDQSPKYTEYNPENTQNSDETNRAKRAHPRLKTEKQQRSTESPRKLQRFRKIKEPTVAASNVEPIEPTAANVEQVETTDRPLKRRSKLRQVKTSKDEYQEPDQDDLKAKSSNTQVQTQNPNVQLQSSQYSNVQEQNNQYRRPVEQTLYVPYESGAGVRQYQSPNSNEAANVPRLFLEAATGHVVDRATGKAYILQPVAVNNNYN
ncbi:protein PFC0760c-like [Hyposmocoma kahamanoa]|uniref:protein PFC0760c-like n=1 Tax=Hyposmocoma kahamanoa TaxID=1477025 RepID=UPI000E6D9FED|nr:protein PFC0760c-like [Hyposmocoma kahamanoa]